ncbi:hypothetical protein CYY_004372 [Polysphondylium violaceum]|uniref:Right handed beta helix domain-containing protein n=1 Tax=Polysphondylium violaceum TaxID=133409 RepID=A0A8J4V573_9MYCE|nr:hypothetical protein CYY_004372 [Polysphondylium violaceum]
MIKPSILLSLFVLLFVVCGGVYSETTVLYVKSSAQQKTYCGAYQSDPCSSIDLALENFKKTTSPAKYSNGVTVVLMDQIYNLVSESVEVTGLNVTITSNQGIQTTIYGQDRSQALFVIKPSIQPTTFIIDRVAFQSFNSGPIANFQFSSNGSTNKVTLKRVIVTESIQDGAVLFNVSQSLKGSDTTFNIFDSLFDHNNVLLMDAYKISVNIQNSSFYNNTNDILFDLHQTNSTINNCLFNFSGSITFDYGGSAFINSSTFSNGTSAYPPITTKSDLVVSNSIFQYNIGNSAGGILFIGSHFKINNCQFINNNGFAGALSFTSSSMGFVQNSLLLDNYGSGSMAFYASSSTVSVSNTNITTSFAMQGSYNQLIDVEYSTISFSNSIVSSQSIPWGTFSVVSCTTSSISVANTTIDSNGYDATARNHGNNILFDCVPSSCLVANIDTSYDNSPTYQCDKFQYRDYDPVVRVYLLTGLIISIGFFVIGVIIIGCCIKRSKACKDNTIQPEGNSFVINIVGETKPLVANNNNMNNKIITPTAIITAPSGYSYI